MLDRIALRIGRRGARRTGSSRNGAGSEDQRKRRDPDAQPHQKIHFNIQKQKVEYWNYDYPGGLHYTSNITCSWIDGPSHQTRFMFQIPAGFPRLSGLYVVAYIKIVDVPTKQYLYGHTSTSDLATATQWCQTGTGLAPATYTVKSGKLYVKNVGSNLLMAANPLLR